MTLEYRNGHGERWRVLKHDVTTADGTWTTTTRYRGNRRYRVRWTDPAGRTWVGSPTRSYARR